MCPGERAYLTSVHCPNLSIRFGRIEKVTLEMLSLFEKIVKGCPDWKTC